LCTGDWVLVLDAGERFTPSDASGLRSFVQSHDPAAAAYLLVVRIPPKTGEIAAEQFAAVRLFPNDPALRYSGRVRESLLPSIESLGWQLEGLPFRIHRGLRDLDPVRTRERAERNLRLAQLQ